MSLEMPGGLQHAFSLLGLDWPQADEDKLFAAGEAWTAFGGELRDVGSSATETAAAIWGSTTGDAAQAFEKWWDSEPKTKLAHDAEAADTVATMLHAFGALTITLKGVYIAQLVILAAEIAQAIATAFITFGASLAEIPVFATAVRFVVKQAIDQVVNEVMS